LLYSYREYGDTVVAVVFFCKVNLCILYYEEGVDDYEERGISRVRIVGGVGGSTP